MYYIQNCTESKNKEEDDVKHEIQEEVQGVDINSMDMSVDKEIMVAVWLSEEVELNEYVELFIENGFNDMDTIKGIKIEDLEAIGITKQGHKRKIIMAVEKLNGDSIEEDQVDDNDRDIDVEYDWTAFQSKKDNDAEVNEATDSEQDEQEENEQVAYEYYDGQPEEIDAEQQEQSVNVKVLQDVNVNVDQMEEPSMPDAINNGEQFGEGEGEPDAPELDEVESKDQQHEVIRDQIRNEIITATQSMSEQPSTNPFDNYSSNPFANTHKSEPTIISQPNEDTLSHGWGVAYTPDNKPYYQNEITKETQWERPTSTEEPIVRAHTAQSPTVILVQPLQPAVIVQQPTDFMHMASETEIVMRKDTNMSEKEETNIAHTRSLSMGSNISRKSRTSQHSRKESDIDLMRASTSRFNIIKSNISLHIYVFLFMVTDFYIRSMPIVCFVASLPCPSIEEFCWSRTIAFVAIFGCLIIFEFRMNQTMRIKKKPYSSDKFVLNVFSVSIFSAFYNLLCLLDILEDDPFYGRSVIFRKFMQEHIIRIILSVVICITGIVATNSSFVDIGGALYTVNTSLYAIIMVFAVGYVGCLFVHICLLLRVRKIFPDAREMGIMDIWRR